MKKLVLFVLFMLALCPAACSRRAAPKPSGPLSVEEWKLLPAEEKFTFQTMERLKQGDPKFQNDEAWDRFAQTIFVPAQKEEFPNGLPPRK